MVVLGEFGHLDHHDSVRHHPGSMVGDTFTQTGIILQFQLLIRNDQPERKQVLTEDRYNATNFYTLLDFEGILKYSPLFYGWYTDRDVPGKGYRLPLAYFMTGLAAYVYNFVATLRK